MMIMDLLYPEKCSVKVNSPVFISLGYKVCVCMSIGRGCFKGVTCKSVLVATCVVQDMSV